MRNEVLDYIKGLNLGSYTVSEEIPRVESGIPLYLRNPKKIYIDSANYDEQPLIQTFSGFDLHSYTTLLTVIFSNDAKQLPNNYDTLVGQLISAKDLVSSEGFNSREATVTTNIESDLLVTQIEYSYTKLR
jgi:hypothetical protein|tara:strand:+ start:6418 stop:6810 length:393 start_codon:yes stop_codon:yes gene_type:complete